MQRVVVVACVKTLRPSQHSQSTCFVAGVFFFFSTTCTRQHIQCVNSCEVQNVQRGFGVLSTLFTSLFFSREATKIPKCDFECPACVLTRKKSFKTALDKNDFSLKGLRCGSTCKKMVRFKTRISEQWQLK